MCVCVCICVCVVVGVGGGSRGSLLERGLHMHTHTHTHTHIHTHTQTHTHARLYLSASVHVPHASTETHVPQGATVYDSETAHPQNQPSHTTNASCTKRQHHQTTPTLSSSEVSWSCRVSDSACNRPAFSCRSTFLKHHGEYIIYQMVHGISLSTSLNTMVNT